MACTFGILVDPPTSTTSCTLRLSIPITHTLLHWSHGISEIVHVKFLKPCT